MPTKAKFPLNIPMASYRHERSAAQDLAFGRAELDSAIRFLGAPGLADARALLVRARDLLPQPTVMKLGCQRCNGDVPLDQPDLVEDCYCRACADVIDAAVAERRAAMRAARKAA